MIVLNLLLNRCLLPQPRALLSTRCLTEELKFLLQFLIVFLKQFSVSHFSPSLALFFPFSSSSIQAQAVLQLSTGEQLSSKPFFKDPFADRQDMNRDADWIMSGSEY